MVNPCRGTNDVSITSSIIPLSLLKHHQGKGLLGLRLIFSWVEPLQLCPRLSLPQLSGWNFRFRTRMRWSRVVGFLNHTRVLVTVLGEQWRMKVSFYCGKETLLMSSITSQLRLVFSKTELDNARFTYVLMNIHSFNRHWTLLLKITSRGSLTSINLKMVTGNGLLATWDQEVLLVLPPFCLCIPWTMLELLSKWCQGSKEGGSWGWQFNGLVDVYKKTLSSDGIAGLYRGFNISCVGIFVYRSLYFRISDSLKPVLLTGKMQVYFMTLLFL